MRESSVNGVMQASLLQRLQRGAELSGPGAGASPRNGAIGGPMADRHNGGSAAPRRPARKASPGRAPLGGPRRLSLPGLLAWGALAAAAAVGLGVTGASPLVA